MPHTATLLHVAFDTHDVKRFIFSRPEGLDFQPGQAIELALDRDGWRDEARPFTMTSLPDAGVLEFTIKGYPKHDGVTTRLHGLAPGDTVLLGDPFDTYSYTGPGVFLAGGAGITPFLAILRDLDRRGELAEQHLVFSNLTQRDVICEKELRHLLGDRLTLTCTETSGAGCDDRRLDRAYLEEKFDGFEGRRFYICGPPGFVEDLKTALADLGASTEDILV
jgi:ferredoxin-NADP reductase